MMMRNRDFLFFFSSAKKALFYATGFSVLGYESSISTAGYMFIVF